MKFAEHKSFEDGPLLTVDDLSSLLDYSYEAVVVYDEDFRFLYLNAEAERLMGYTSAEMIGKVLWEEFPSRSSPFYNALTRAMTEQVALTFEEEYVPTNTTTEGRCVPIHLAGHTGKTLAVYFRNITESKQAAAKLSEAYEREHLLNEIGSLIRASRTPEEIQAVTASALGKALGADRCYFNFFDPSRDVTWIESDWHREGLKSVAGRYPLSEVQTLLLDDLFRDGATLAIADVRSSHLTQETAQLLEQFGYRALITTPFYGDGQLRAVLVVTMAEASRIWKQDELALVETVAAQTRSGVEAARLLAELHARINREELINRIGAVIRSSTDAEAITTMAVKWLGEALGADRCYFATYDLARSVITIRAEWHAPGLPSIRGVHGFVNTAEMFRELYKEASTSVIADAHNAGLSQQTIANMDSLQLRSRVSVALLDADGLMATLSAATSHAPREWTLDEVSLIEIVATQMRTALETVNLQRREHRIATELQAALQPTVPELVLGLKIAKFIKPALDEAAIGGDFFDVFPLDKEMYALIIGDVSGKGLAAAAQVAMVRNMLRSFMYQHKEPTEAVTYLNAIVTTHNLLSGFVTVFAGIYEAGPGRLSYTSCGHEPGLVHRAATDTVEHLVSAGAPLGINENAVYRTEATYLSQDDMLLLYTDGLSEAGPNRTQLLGTDGLTRILQASRDIPDVDAIAAQIVADVSDFAEGAFRDDVCVVLARRTL